MKSHFLFIINLFIVNILYSQVGINNNNPTATLDIINSEETMSSISIKDAKLLELFKVDKSSNLHINGALMPSGNPGKAGEFLTSKGDNISPTWTTKPISSTVQIFNAQRDDISTINVDGGLNRVLDFPVVNSNVNTDYGIWNSSKNEFTVKKRGIYHITAGMIVDNTRNLTNTSTDIYDIALFIVTSKSVTVGSSLKYMTGNKYNISTYGTYSLILDVGDFLYIAANTGHPDSRWNQGSSYLNIQFSELD